MSDKTTVIQEIIKQAIQGEADAYALYTSGAGRVKSTQAKAMLEEMAKDELGHRTKLEKLLQQGLRWEIARGAFKKVNDLKVGDHLVAKPLD